MCSSDLNSGSGTTPATVISKVSGDNQRGSASQLLRNPLVAVVTNTAGIPVAGVLVDIAVTSGGGIISNSQTISDSQGVVYANWTLGSLPGVNTISFSANGLAGSPLTFTSVSAKRRTQLVGE